MAHDDPAGTVIYDGDCGFCTSSARWLDARAACEIAPWQACDLAALGLRAEQTSTSVWWIDAPVPGSPSTRLSGAAAVARALRTCGQPYAVIGRMLQLPLLRNLADVVYRAVARNRHRLPGSTCSY